MQESKNIRLNQMLEIAIELTPSFKLMFVDELVREPNHEVRNEISENLYFYEGLLRKFKEYVYATNLNVEVIPLTNQELFDLGDILQDLDYRVPERTLRERINWFINELETLKN